MTTVNLSTVPLPMLSPSRYEKAEVGNENADQHHQIEALITSATHQDNLAGHGFSIGEIPEQLESILKQHPHDLEHNLQSFMAEAIKAPLTLVSLDEKNHLASAVTVKTDNNDELTFQYSSLTPGGTHTERKTGSLNNADEKNDLLKTLNLANFSLLSKEKEDVQNPGNTLQPISTVRTLPEHRKSALKTRHTPAEPVTHSPAKAKKSVRFSPDKVTTSEIEKNNPNKNNVRIDENIVGTINSTHNNMIFDHCEIEHKPGTEESKPLLTSNSGEIKIKNGSVVFGKIMSSTGEINIENAISADDILNLRGGIRLHSFSGCLGTLYSLHGKIEVESSNAGSINNKHGEISINKSTIKKDVNAGSGPLSINASTIKGTLTARNDNLKIGRGCNIENLVLKKPLSPSTTAQYQNRANATTLNITLGEGTTLNNLSFDAEYCHLTLSKNAVYSGDVMPNLKIIRNS